MGLIDGISKDLPGHYSSSRWVQLLLGPYAWKEIAFGTPSPCILPKSCSCSDDYHVQLSPLVDVGSVAAMVLGLHSLSYVAFVFMDNRFFKGG